MPTEERADYAEGMQGALEAIFITARKGDPLSSVTKVEALPGRGLAGDRYASGQGTFSNAIKDDREVTLIEAEAIEAANRDYGTQLTPAATRRNLLTRGVALNHLVGKRFSVGAVILEGQGLCEPCKRLQKLTEPTALKALVHRGGLRARIVSGGTLQVGDAIRAL